MEYLLQLVEYVDRACLRAGKLRRFGDNRGQNGLKVERGVLR